MTFASPTALWWGLAGAAIVALYLLKTRHRRIAVSTVMFWEQVFEQSRPRAWWRQLRHVLSLLVQLLIILLLVLAIAELIAPWQSLKPRRIAIVIDDSASMGAPLDHTTRLSAAKHEAQFIIDSLGDFDEATILTIAGSPRAQCGMTSHRRTLLHAVDAIVQSRGVADATGAITLARSVADEVILITDSNAPIEGATPMRVGRSIDNVAITRLGVRRSLIDPIGYRIFVEVRNFATAATSCRFELSLGEQVLDVVPITLEPDDTWRHVFEETSTSGGLLEAKIIAKDAWGDDNIASAQLPPRHPVRVTLRGEPNVFIARALDALPLVQPALQGGDVDITIYHREVPNVIPPGPAMVIDPRSSTNLWNVGDLLTEPIVAAQNDTSPLLAHVQLQNIYIPEARQIDPRENADVLAAGPDGEAIITAFDRAEGRVIVIAADVAAGDLPLRTAFPIFMTNAINWLSRTGGEPVIASDIIDAAECDLRMSEITSPNTNARTSGGKPMWFYLLSAAVVLLTLEWWLHQRRWIS